ncbi:MAG: 5'/3'-nucleotidase SurE [Deltaproteobacteria bacterium]|nr:5'/3'-nucleotidase SurE [Deltaproteobacteria bacterium]
MSLSAGALRPLILVTNDDGIHAEGIKALARALVTIADVAVFAPDRNRSGVSHSISLLRPLRVIELAPGWHQIDGTPADCVYLAVHDVLQRRPDLVVSGINAGPNLSFDVHYSGTVGGAMEGTLLGIPGIAVSLANTRHGSFELAAEFTKSLAAWVLANGMPANTTFNVNVPGGTPKGWQLTFMGHRLFRHAVERRQDPRGFPYYWIGGVPDEPRDIPGSDCNAIADGLISVTPLSVDLTHRSVFDRRLPGLEIEALPEVPPIAPPGEAPAIGQARR